MKEDLRQFHGVWIDKLIWLDSSLSPLEKVVLTEIIFFDNEETGCFITNDTLSAFCQCSERTIIRALKKLESLGYISIVYLDTQKRIIRSRVKYCIIPADTGDKMSGGTGDKMSPPGDKMSPVCRINELNNNNNNYILCQNKETPPYAEIVELYLSTCVSLPKITRLTDTRKSNINARWKEYHNIETFKTVFSKAETSDYLKGQNDRGWKADFDFIINPNKFTRILEGKYDNDRWNGKAEKKPEFKSSSFDNEDFFNAALERSYGKK